MNTSDSISCPKCQSTQCHADRRGWTPKHGLLGKGKVVITCLACGFEFPPGGVKPSSLSASAQRVAVAVMVIVIIAVVWGISNIN